LPKRDKTQDVAQQIVKQSKKQSYFSGISI